MKPTVIYDKLLDELEQVDEGLGLDTVTREKKQELRKIESAISKGKGEVSGIKASVEELRQERAALKEALSEERKHITGELRSIRTIAKKTINGLKKDLSSGISESIIEVNRLREQALELGNELGKYNEIIESNKWLKGLLAIINGDKKEVEAEQVRVVLMKIARGVLPWLNDHTEDVIVLWYIRAAINDLIRGLEQWKVE
jgi:predicted RNase H-like nuclease (RuvC/YqgF family)